MARPIDVRAGRLDMYSNVALWFAIAAVVFLAVAWLGAGRQLLAFHFGLAGAVLFLTGTHLLCRVMASRLRATTADRIVTSRLEAEHANAQAQAQLRAAEAEAAADLARATELAAVALGQAPARPDYVVPAHQPQTTPGPLRPELRTGRRPTRRAVA